MSQKSILITGATGFIGKFLVQKAIDSGFLVYAGTRNPTKDAIQTSGVIPFFMDFKNPESMANSIRDCENLQAVIHGAGTTKAIRKEDYFKGNTEATVALQQAVIQSGVSLKKFLYISSLAALGPSNHAEVKIKETDSEKPVTSYGWSKLKAEQALKKIDRFPVTIIRPTNVFGPWEKDFYIFFKLIHGGFEPYIGFSKQPVSFIFVKDLVDAVFLVLEKGKSGYPYLAHDGQNHFNTDLGIAIRKSMENKKTLKVHIPVWAANIIAKINQARGGIQALNSEKMEELSAKSWACEKGALFNELNFHPRYSLEKGIEETTAWYREMGWL